MYPTNLLLPASDAGKPIQKFLKKEDLEWITCRNGLVGNQKISKYFYICTRPLALATEVGGNDSLIPLSNCPMIIPTCLYTDTIRIILGLQDLLNNKFSVLLASSLLVFFSIACFLPSHFFVPPPSASKLCQDVHHSICPSRRDTNSWSLLKVCSASVQRPGCKVMQPLGKAWIAIIISKVLFYFLLQWGWKKTSVTMMLFWQYLESKHEPKVLEKSRKGVSPSFGSWIILYDEKNTLVPKAFPEV